MSLQALAEALAAHGGTLARLLTTADPGIPPYSPFHKYSALSVIFRVNGIRTPAVARQDLVR